MYRRFATSPGDFDSVAYRGHVAARSTYIDIHVCICVSGESYRDFWDVGGCTFEEEVERDLASGFTYLGGGKFALVE